MRRSLALELPSGTILIHCDRQRGAILSVTNDVTPHEGFLINFF